MIGDFGTGNWLTYCFSFSFVSSISLLNLSEFNELIKSAYSQPDLFWASTANFAAISRKSTYEN